MGENLVVVEFNAGTDSISEARSLGIPVIHDDATRPVTLEAANIRHARTIILASQNGQVLYKTQETLLRQMRGLDKLIGDPRPSPPPK